MREVNEYRKTNETEVSIYINLDGTGKFNIETGIGFFDHMLQQLSKHSLIDINITAEGDLRVDSHHIIEDVGIVLGKSFRKAINDGPITRYGESLTPMDETLFACSVDICNRGNLSMDYNLFSIDRLGDLETEMIYEFFKAFAYNSGINIHLIKFRGLNNHHIAECVFKAFARALRKAIVKVDNIMSTKGVI